MPDPPSSPKPSNTTKSKVCSPTRPVPFESKSANRCLGCRVQSGLSRDCKHCGINAYRRQLAEHSLTESPGVHGLHSSWITDYALGMQRLHQGSIVEIVDRFATCGIGSVFNLTQPGEHPYCGHELLESSGFSYDPGVLMAKGINHFNYNWEDMTTPTMSLLLDIVQVALLEIQRGSKIAVHCHAGYGRTGTVIACVIIAKDGLDSQSAVNLVREKRPGSIQTQKQEAIIKDFESTWREAMCEYPASPSTFTLAPDAPSTPPSKGKASRNDIDESFGPGTPAVSPLSSPAPKAAVSDSPSSAAGIGSGIGTMVLPSSPSKSIAKSVRDARMFHSAEEILSYHDNYLRFTSKTVVQCCTVLRMAAAKGEDDAKNVLENFGNIDQGDTGGLVLQAKARINGGDWGIFQELEGRLDVVSLLLLDWLSSRSDSALDMPALLAIHASLGAAPNQAAGEQEIIKAMIDHLRPLCTSVDKGSQEEPVLGPVLMAAMQKPQLYLLEQLVRLLTSLGSSVGIQDLSRLSGHEHRSLIMRVVLLVAAAIAPGGDKGDSDGGGEYMPARGLGEQVLGSMEDAIFDGEGGTDLASGNSVTAVACVLLLLSSQKFSVPAVLSPAKKRALMGTEEGVHQEIII